MFIIWKTPPNSFATFTSDEISGSEVSCDPGTYITSHTLENRFLTVVFAKLLSFLFSTQKVEDFIYFKIYR